MKTFKQILNEAGKQTERQENAFVDAINDAIKTNEGNPVDIVSNGGKIPGVMKAEKFKGRSISGAEPYTDVQLITKSGKINLSMKGPKAPSSAGGGGKGMELLVPGLATKFMKAALKLHLKNGLQPGEKAPDLYGKIKKKDRMILVIGNESIGGPIDFMYIGPMAVKSSFKEGKVRVSGNLIPAVKYANSTVLYLRLRARFGDQTFDPTSVDKKGVPKIYGKSKGGGDSSGRLVATTQIVKSRELVKF